VSPFLARLARGLVVFDGALATELRAAGWPAERPVELASLEAPALLRRVHEAYRRAGAEVLTANTTGAHGLRADGSRLADRGQEACRVAVALAREVAGPDGWVAASIGPPGQPVHALGDGSYRVAVAAYRRQLAACRAAGVDLFVLESFPDLLELQAALTAAREEGAAPLAVSMALRPDRLAAGLVSPEAAVEVAQALGADLVGLNCMPPSQTATLLARFVGRARVPVFVQPAASLPSPAAGPAPGDVAEWARRLAGLGVGAVGGCCGTTPAHIEALAGGTARAKRRSGDGRPGPPR
jgi:5-methyltetrahydrofolate--homocysteine methyltransferase